MTCLSLSSYHALAASFSSLTCGPAVTHLNFWQIVGTGINRKNILSFSSCLSGHQLQLRCHLHYCFPALGMPCPSKMEGGDPFPTVSHRRQEFLSLFQSFQQSILLGPSQPPVTKDESSQAGGVFVSCRSLLHAPILYSVEGDWQAVIRGSLLLREQQQDFLTSRAPNPSL